MVKKLFTLFLALLWCSTCFAAEDIEPKEPSPAAGNPNVTDIIFILDRSGSMYGLENDTIGGFNSLLKKQKEEISGEVYVSCVLFNHESHLLYDRTELAKVSEMTNKDYVVSGNTALLDAAGNEILRLDQVYEELKEDRPGKVLFVMITDGKENSSREFTQPKLKEIIDKHQKENGWEFLFLGANIDAITVAGSYGISADRAAEYHNDSTGVANNFLAVNEAATSLRRDGKVSEHWADNVKEDYSTRK